MTHLHIPYFKRKKEITANANHSILNPSGIIFYSSEANDKKGSLVKLLGATGEMNCFFNGHAAITQLHF